MTALPESLTAAALLGTARSAPEFGALHTAGAAGELAGDPAATLLAAAALEATFLTAATVPVIRELPSPAPDDDRPVLPGAAAERLRALLAVRSPLLDEWFEVAARLRASHDIVVDLLIVATTDAVHRDRLIALTGARGRWVAARHPEWADLLPPDPLDDTPWHVGPPARRRRWFEVLRAHDPAAATATLAASWGAQTAAQRAELVALLAVGLGPHDEDLLERALDDRSRKVRAVALDLLPRLPDSAFARRMTERVRQWLLVDGSTVTLAVPERPDESALRDGLSDGPARDLLVAAVAAAPLSVWREHVGDGVLPEFDVDDALRTALTDAWGRAAVRQRDSGWAAALLRRDGTGDTSVARVVPRDILLTHLREASPPAVLDDALLAALPAPWPRDVAERVLTALYTKLTTTRLVSDVLTLLAHRAPFELADLLADAANRTDDLGRLHLFASAADTLTLRKTIHEELS
ncbi:DUF5691 domain-containing protein [Rhodococcus pyridinivorans]|uniref:Uncharacterized protein n=1 Tax=Rhodococcus pyridinivorans AK37 TaxID=1114960 RepID=H0JWR9_9NOCA|nr:DUF5691 domain-containing protein [Rhodococcus pyridinivorans]EHK81278.1 hypothetical protein AK37_20939 [Rhodococcus pyridinivorans AK37]MCD2139160.1 DUF5691 domain-containing protein [Rhodococcus pyridinivorans]